ncbi:electron transporter SenC [Methylosinus sp. R-45379]|jgi:protein SCO1/2|uniref:SCO family protein n=1 Tax=unclassified Methylosinus TaxID=2624500 RepID=UPI00047C530C|nr:MULTISPECIES: SCO family protein [unclassified Methylosinus]OAI24030.1 electron transporter SenC [Methylosinus sp. R-45379]
MSKSYAKSSQKGRAKGRDLPKLPLFAIGGVFLAAFAALVAFTSLKPPPPPASAIGGPFQLVAHNGQTVTEKDFLGRPFLVFFGYTHCPDICHTTLFEISEVLRALGPKANAGALFVTVDPERDTPAVLKDYLSNFDPRIVGVSGERAQLDPMLKEYRIYSKKAAESGEDYAVDHTTVVYLMDKNGRFVSSFNVGRKPADAARDLERFL